MSRQLAADETISVVHKAVIANGKTTDEIVNTLNSGTAKEKHLVSNECDIIFECKVCRNLFRTLPSFIAHKQVYCLQCMVGFDVLNAKKDETAQTYSKQLLSSSESLFRELEKKSIADNEVTVRPSSIATKVCQVQSLKKDAVSSMGLAHQSAASKDIQYTLVKEKEIKTDQFSNSSQVVASSPQKGYRKNQSDTSVKISYGVDLDSEKRKINVENRSNGKPVLAKAKLDGDKKIIPEHAPKKIESTAKESQVKSATSADAVNSSAGKHRVSVRFSRRIEKMNEKIVEKSEKKESQKKEELKDQPLRKSKRKSFMEVVGDFKRLKCRKCDVRYTSVKRLENHIRIRHTEVRKSFVCPCCPVKKIFECLSDVVKHLQNDHHLRKRQISKLQQKLKERTWNKKDAANLRVRLFGSEEKQAEDNSIEVTLKPEKTNDSSVRVHPKVSAEAGQKKQNSDLPAEHCHVDVHQEKKETVEVHQKKPGEEEKKENKDVPVEQCLGLHQEKKETVEVHQKKPGEAEEEKKENLDVQPKQLDTVHVQVKTSADVEQGIVDVQLKKPGVEPEQKETPDLQPQKIVEAEKVEKLDAQLKQSVVEEGPKKEKVDIQPKKPSVNEEQEKKENTVIQPMKSIIVNESETKLKLPSKLYLCPFCQKSNQFTYFSGLIIHLRTIHSLKRHQIYQMRQKLRENIQVEDPVEVLPEASQADKEYIDCPRCLKSVKKKLLKDHFEQCVRQTLKLDTPKQQPEPGSRLSSTPVASKVVTLQQAAKDTSQPSRSPANVAVATNLKQSKVEDEQRTKARADTYVLPAAKSYDACQYSDNLSKMTNNQMVVSKAKSAKKKSLPLEEIKTATRKHSVPKFQEIWVAKTPGKPSEVVKSSQHYMKAKDKKLSEDMSGEDDEEISQFVTLEPLQCKLCRKHFTFIQHYKRHVALCETNQKFKEIVDMDNLRCFLCSSVFSNTQHLKRHASKHLGFFRFKCKMCDFTAFYQSEIKQHLSTHKTHKVDMSKWESYIEDLEPDTQLEGREQKIKNYNVAIKSRRKSGTQVRTTKRSSKTAVVPTMPVKTDKISKVTRSSTKSGKRGYRRVKRGARNRKKTGKASKVKDASEKTNAKRATPGRIKKKDVDNLENDSMVENSLLSSNEKMKDLPEGVDRVNGSSPPPLKKIKFEEFSEDLPSTDMHADEAAPHLTPEIYNEKTLLATKEDLSSSAKRTNSSQNANVKVKAVADRVQEQASSKDEEISMEESTQIDNSADTVSSKSNLTLTLVSKSSHRAQSSPATSLLSNRPPKKRWGSCEKAGLKKLSNIGGLVSSSNISFPSASKARFSALGIAEKK